MITAWLLGPAFVAAQQPPRDFRVDAAHSTIGFSVGFLGFPVRGRFDDVHGTIAYVPGHLTASSVSVVISAKSISTGSAHRDQHLKSPDFFDVERYPSIVFQSRTMERRGDSLVMKGPLTIHGVTRDVVIPFREPRAPIEDPHGSTLLFFSGAIRLNRKDFGIQGGSTYNDWFDAVRSATMADSVDIELDIQGWDTDYTREHRYDVAVARVEHNGIDSTLARLQRMRTQSPDTLRDAEWQLTQVAGCYRCGESMIRRSS